MLEGIDDIDWSVLEHAYGPATDVPDLVRALVAASADEREKALRTLYGNVFHQGTRYEATAHVVPFLLDLVRPARLANGDGLVLADGTIIRVIAKPEPLVEAIATDTQHLARLAWHVGNRHVAAQIVDERRLRIAHDSVLDQMLRGLGAETRTVTAPFHPEGGAYATLATGHGHD